MTTIPNKGNFPAFPLRISDHSYFAGMSKREVFAALAMYGSLASGLHGSARYHAQKALHCADELIKELEKEVAE